MFLVFEGVEGSGKTTQVDLLADWLAERAIPHIAVREPGTTAVGEQIRTLLLEQGSVPARAELLLMLAARAVLVEERVRPALENGRVVLADRYDLSTLAYQGHGRGLPLEDVRRLNGFATDGVRPDLTLVLDLPMERAESRRAGGSRGRDRIEGAGRAFHARVAEAYHSLAEREPRVEAVDACGGPGDVHALVLARLRERFAARFGDRGGADGS